MVGYQLQAVDGGYYMAYNIVAVTAAKDTFIEWEGVPTDCFKTLPYTDISAKMVDASVFSYSELFLSSTS